MTANGGWRPIDSAPVKPFADVEVWYRFKALAFPVYGEVAQAHAEYTRRGLLRWYTAGGTWITPSPTHWMPLPDPPVQP